MTGALTGIAKDVGRAFMPSASDFILNPALTAARILAESPEAIPTLPSYRIPQFADLEPLAKLVGADPKAHLKAVRALERHRADISDAFASAGILAAATAAELAHIVGSFLAAVPGALVANAPGGPLAQARAIAILAGKALWDAHGAIQNLTEELNRVAERLIAATAAALKVPLPGGGATSQLATEALQRLASSARPHATAGGVQLPPLPTQLAVPAAASPAAAQPVSPVPQVATLAPPQPQSSAGAAAVAAAKSQLGAPYVWGGNQPGGFDCSGLTSWAYRQAGIELPRTAASQAVGRQVTFHELMPGDLVLWDGHAAMYTGEGMMIEAGSPVQLNPVRTNNLGMAFLGFWRPTG